MKFSLNVFTEFAEFEFAVFEATISCVRDRDDTIVPDRHR